MKKIVAVKCMLYYPVSLEDCKKCKRHLREDSEHVVCLRRIRPRRGQQKKAKVNAYQCSICGALVLLPWKHLRYHEEEKKNKIISANLKILNDNQSSSFRKKLAIYRLYKHARLSPQEIADLTYRSESYIKEIISEIFVALCLSHKKCVFRKVLKRDRKLGVFSKAKKGKES